MFSVKLSFGLDLAVSNLEFSAKKTRHPLRDAGS
jgi:hypothetical protein